MVLAREKSRVITHHIMCDKTRCVKNKMIDEYWTWIFYGYHSDDLTPHSHKQIVIVCDECGKYRAIPKGDYRDFCPSCARIGERNVNFGKPRTEELKRKVSKSKMGKKLPPWPDERKQRLSAYRQGVPYEKWTGFTTENLYCKKFDETCRERIRDECDRTCFVCGKNEEDNGRKLAVHHVDRNKEQGCNGHDWKLVALCTRCHGSAHSDPMKSRIAYILDDDRNINMQ